MRGYVWPGLILAVATGLLVWGGDALGLELEHVALLGAALGGALGLVPDRSPLARAGGFLIGALAAWIGYAVRAAWLPDSSSGRAVAAMLVVVVAMFAAFLAAGRLPLWAMLLGAAGVVGAYEDPYTAAPAEFLSTSPTALTTVLMAAALGFLATIVLGTQIEDERARERDHHDDDDSGEADADDVDDNAGRGRRRRSGSAAPPADDTFWEGALR